MPAQVRLRASRLSGVLAAEGMAACWIEYPRRRVPLGIPCDRRHCSLARKRPRRTRPAALEPAPSAQLLGEVSVLIGGEICLSAGQHGASGVHLAAPCGRRPRRAPRARPWHPRRLALTGTRAGRRRPRTARRCAPRVRGEERIEPCPPIVRVSVDPVTPLLLQLGRIDLAEVTRRKRDALGRCFGEDVERADEVAGRRFELSAGRKGGRSACEAVIGHALASPPLRTRSR
jgi:hypothetical protein